MEVDVLIFGAAADRAQSDRVTVTLREADAHCTVRDVLVALTEQHPALRFALPEPGTERLAVNHVLAPGNHKIKPGDEIALIALVGGG